ncbi:pentapeptide repeat-containing protein [Psychromonas algicola]|uniref:pentapeptide repeat-containing protein n=1 Tax=Psychromonas algicola TaxID=2555642 RepID=UPI0010671CEE|nr:pentapeptide repeat-containing protein [Psychromonas sp. RZ5]TEW51459.1 pentapeptide repeat-containing protein [Psychromonas sp. RZ5]
MPANKIESNEEYFQQAFNKHIFLQEAGQALTISDTEFEDCEFNDCDFSAAIFTRCKFVNCAFNRCNLSLMKVPYSQFFEVNFVDSKLVGIDWTRATWPSFNLCSELTFTRCILNDASFFGLSLNELKLEECKLYEVDFREGDFSNSVMTYCDFTNSLFMRTNLKNVDFTESENFNIDILQNTVTKAKFSRFAALALLEELDIELVD